MPYIERQKTQMSRDERPTMVHKTLQRQLKVERTSLHTGNGPRCLRNVSSSCSTSHTNDIVFFINIWSSFSVRCFILQHLNFINTARSVSWHFNT